MSFSKLSAFLRSSKSSFVNRSPDKVLHVVLGNQAADADSIISALCHAYIQQESSKLDNISYIPVACISRSDIHFRREVQILLGMVSLTLDDLICLDEIHLSTMLKEGNVELTLTDHNVLDPKLGDTLSPSVKHIIDHHSDCGEYLWVTGNNRNIAYDSSLGKATVGSACTLIAENFLKLFESAECSLDVAIATLLLGVITLDTINMDPSAGIGTDRDRSAITALESISESHPPRGEMFEQLRGAKLDPVFWRELSAHDALRLDYKHFPTLLSPGMGVGIASVLQPLYCFIEKPDLREAVERAMEEQKLNALVVLTFVHHPSPTREILICSSSQSYVSKAVDFLKSYDTVDFDLSPLEELDFATVMGPGINCAAFHQGAVKPSRKQVAPAIQMFENSSAHS